MKLLLCAGCCRAVWDVLLGNNYSNKKTEKVVRVLNPYMSSLNVRLILDLVAARSGGVGVALRLLAFLEVDVMTNWKPFKPEIQILVVE